MATKRSNAISATYNENPTGFSFGGGLSATILSVTGSNVTIEGGGTATYTFPTTGGTVAIMPFTYVNMNGITAEPENPAMGNAVIYAKAISGKMALKVKGFSGIDSPLQSALYQNSFWLVQPNTTTSVSAIGGAVTSVGTISHPTPGLTSYGYASNFVTAGSTGASAGTGQAIAPLNLSSSNAACGGLFFAARLVYPDAGYTAARHWVGVSDQVNSNMVGATNPAGSRMGFIMSTSISETHWMFSTRAGSTVSRIDTGMTFSSPSMYDFYIFAKPGATVVYWRVDNLTTTSVSSIEGNTSSFLPATATFMRAGFCLSTLNATVRNVRMKKIYVETDV